MKEYQYPWECRIRSEDLSSLHDLLSRSTEQFMPVSDLHKVPRYGQMFSESLYSAIKQRFNVDVIESDIPVVWGIMNIFDRHHAVVWFRAGMYIIDSKAYSAPRVGDIITCVTDHGRVDNATVIYVNNPLVNLNDALRIYVELPDGTRTNALGSFFNLRRST